MTPFIEITLRHGCSPVNLLHIFKTPFLKNTFGGLLLDSHDDFLYQNGNDGLSLSKNILIADIFTGYCFFLLTHFIQEMAAQCPKKV